MSWPKSTTTPSRDYRDLAIESLSDELVALQAALADALGDAATWRSVALEALSELHEATAERDATDRTADEAEDVEAAS